MARSRPQTFEAAVKHLFKHFRDPARLRSNPIVRGLFGKLPSVTSNDDVIRQLHAAVAYLAKRYREEDLAAGKWERAVRQFEIVRLQCIEGKPISDTAIALGISARHCYRERAEICRRLGRGLLELHQQNVTTVVQEDGFYILLDSLMNTESLEQPGGLHALKYLQQTAVAPHHKILAMHLAATMLLDCRDYDEAQAESGRAAQLCEEYALSVPSDVLEMIHTSTELLATRFAWVRGDAKGFYRAASAAVRFAEKIPATDRPFSWSLQTKAHFNLSAARWGLGELEASYDSLMRARLLSERLLARDAMQVTLDTNLWKLRTCLSTTRVGGFSFQARVDGLKATYARAHQLGFHEQAKEALVILAECQVFAGRERDAIHTAAVAMAIAKETGSQVVDAETRIDFAIRLLQTNLWRQALALLPSKEAVLGISYYYQALMGLAMALAALRAAEFELAREMIQADNDDSGWPTLGLRRQIVAAHSTYSLGQVNNAREHTANIVETAEQLGSAPILLEALSLAATVFQERRYGSRAAEIARILAA
jgi:hypothetical protein